MSFLRYRRVRPLSAPGANGMLGWMPGYKETAPKAPLAHFVETFWTREVRSATAEHRVLPDGCMDILFSVRGGAGAHRIRLEVVGTMTRYLDIELPGPACFSGVRFRPGAATAFLGGVASELTDARADLESLWGRQGRELLSHLTEAPDPDSRRRILEQALTERLSAAEARPAGRRSRAPDPLGPSSSGIRTPI